MTSDERTARNRTNAQKSTGPTSRLGKAAVSQNARRHGATAKPHPKSVTAWARVILDAPDLQPGDVLRSDSGLAVALALAAAEVKLCAARAALDAFEGDDAPPTDLHQEFKSLAEDIVFELNTSDMTRKHYLAGISLLRRLSKARLRETALGGDRHRLLRRYLREARQQRQRAFQSWLAYLEQKAEVQYEPA
jgi:hypothetical protein